MTQANKRDCKHGQLGRTCYHEDAKHLINKARKRIAERSASVSCKAVLFREVTDE